MADGQVPRFRQLQDNAFDNGQALARAAGVPPASVYRARVGQVPAPADVTLLAQALAVGEDEVRLSVMAEAAWRQGCVLVRRAATPDAQP